MYNDYIELNLWTLIKHKEDVYNSIIWNSSIV
jgi:hypothetical protein